VLGNYYIGRIGDTRVTDCGDTSKVSGNYYE